MTVYNDTIAEGIGANDTMTPPIVGVVLSDNVLTVDAAPVTTYYIGDPISEAIKLTENADPIRAQLTAIAEGIGAHEAAVVAYGAVVLEIIALAEAASATGIYHVTAAETANILDGLLAGLPVTIAEGIGIHDAQVILQAVAIIEHLGLTDALTPSALYHLTANERVGLASSLANFFSLSVAEGIGIHEVPINTLAAAGLIAEGIGINDAIAPMMVLRVVASETVGLHDDLSLKAIFSPVISEAVQIGVAYISPGGGFTTWAMNTRTAAVTEYSNFNFNSFAALGNRYLGASSTGLYALDGATDAGTNIVADIKSGFAQFAGTHFSSFKAAYLGVRGEGDFVLRLISGEGQTYDYAVSTRNQRSTKVHMGKGLRARYFAFELISTGQDFDLDTIEFIPLTETRRV